MRQLDDGIGDTLVLGLRRAPARRGSSLLCKRQELSEDNGQIFRDRRMNVHGPLDDRVRRPRVHDVQQNVNYFIASDSKNRGSQNLLRFCIDADFDETLGLSFFVGPAHLAHGIFRDQGTTF